MIVLKFSYLIILLLIRSFVLADSSSRNVHIPVDRSNQNIIGVVEDGNNVRTFLISGYGEGESNLDDDQENLGVPNIPNSLLDILAKEVAAEDGKHIYNIPGQDENNEAIGRLKKVKGLDGREDFIASGSKKDQVLIVKSSDAFFKKIYNKGSRQLSISYISDNYEISDRDAIFRRVFSRSAGGRRAGSLFLNLNYFFSKGLINFFYGGGFGFGFNSGKGNFSTGESTDRINIKLWTLPLWAAIGAEIQIFRYLNISGSIGPTLVGLYQSRSDREQDEEGKHRRQIGYGLTGNLKLRVSLGNLFKDSMNQFFKDYKITNYYLNIENRYQSYGNFQDEISIIGFSFGLGLSFDFL